MSRPFIERADGGNGIGRVNGEEDEIRLVSLTVFDIGIVGAGVLEG